MSNSDSTLASGRLTDAQVRALMQVAHKWAGPDNDDARSDDLEMALRAVVVPESVTQDVERFYEREFDAVTEAMGYPPVYDCLTTPAEYAADLFAVVKAARAWGGTETDDEVAMLAAELNLSEALREFDEKTREAATLPPTSQEWMDGPRPPLAVTSEWRAGWDTCRDVCRKLIDAAAAAAIDRTKPCPDVKDCASPARCRKAVRCLMLHDPSSAPLLTVQFTPEEVADLLWNLSIASAAEPSYTAYQKLAAAQNLASMESK